MPPSHLLLRSGQFGVTGSPETIAATFKSKSVDNESLRDRIKPFGFTRIRLEIGGKVFEWPIE
jgi:hypothetical protein